MKLLNALKSGVLHDLAFKKTSDIIKKICISYAAGEVFLNLRFYVVFMYTDLCFFSFLMAISLKLL